MEDTIAAISTSSGAGAISIIRISGPESINIINKIFSHDLTNAKSHTIHYGHIISNNEIIDEVLVSIMRSPKTFTTEDTIEINCHGGYATTNKVLELVLKNGARLAEPGEFTKRAFLNGRIDLLEAESVMDLIDSKTEASRKLSISGLTGNISNKIESLREELIKIISNIEVNIDYPEYEDINVVTNEEILPKVKELKEKIETILSDSDTGKIINNGIDVGIIGKPNVGKSSLLNTLLGEDKAIVTDIEGTTRDIVTGSITLDGILLNFIDTAGIRETNDLVESLGIEKSKDIISKCDLVILLLYNSKELSNEDKYLIDLIKDKKHIIIVNKTDLPTKLNKDNLDTIEISIKENIGIDKLKNKIKELFHLEEIKTSDMTYLSSARSIALLTEAKNKLEEVLNNIELDTPVDIIEIDLKECWNLLGEIIGKTYTDELLDELFQRFCLGK